MDASKLADVQPTTKQSRDMYIKRLQILLKTALGTTFSTAYLVGSVARNSHHEGSDLDIAFIAKKPYRKQVFVALHKQLQQAFQQEVDMIVYEPTNRLYEEDDLYLENNIADAIDLFDVIDASTKHNLKQCRLLWTFLH